MSEIDDLKKLPPEERIKRLKEISEKGKKEIEEAQKRIKESEDEAEDNADMLRKVPIPQIKAVDIESLFSEEEKDAFSTMRFIDRKKIVVKKSRSQQDQKQTQDTNLEQAVAMEKPKVSENELRQNQDYFHALGTVELHHKREEIYESRESQGYINNRQQTELYNINKEMDARRRDAESGVYKTQSEEVAELLGIDIDRSKKQYRHN